MLNVGEHYLKRSRRKKTRLGRPEGQPSLALLLLRDTHLKERSVAVTQKQVVVAALKGTTRRSSSGQATSLATKTTVVQSTTSFLYKDQARVRSECQRHRGEGQLVRRTAFVRPSLATIIGDTEHRSAKKPGILGLHGKITPVCQRYR